MIEQNKKLNKRARDHQSEEALTKKLAERYRVPYLDLAETSLDRKLIQSFPVDFLHRAHFLPLEDNGNVVKIAIADPSDIETIDSIESYMGKKSKFSPLRKRRFSKLCARARQLSRC